jgi:hypothetical protein
VITEPVVSGVDGSDAPSPGFAHINNEGRSVYIDVVRNVSRLNVLRAQYVCKRRCVTFLFLILIFVSPRLYFYKRHVLRSTRVVNVYM